MKVGFHFNAMHKTIIDTAYDTVCEEAIFRILLSHRRLNISSKIFVGDLLLSMNANSIADAQNMKSFEEKFQALVSSWLNPTHSVWAKVIPERFIEALQAEIFVIVFETIPVDIANYINTKLQEMPSYIGAIEVDDATKTHWSLYSNQLIPRYRIINKHLKIFWSGEEWDFQDEGNLEELRELPFNKVDFESLNGRYTVFDEYHNFEQARRVAEWKYRTGDLLAFIAEDVVHRLSDAAPEVGDRLWATLETFENAETNEQYSQVAASCRRIIEYVSDQLLPPSEELHEERKLGTTQYRNRLLAFVDKNRRSNTDIDVIFISTKTLNEQMEKLNNLVNKGTHAEVYRTEARRCLLRTILLLDDINSLKRGPFEIKPKLSYDDFLSSIFGDKEDID